MRYVAVLFLAREGPNDPEIYAIYERREDAEAVLKEIAKRYNWRPIMKYDNGAVDWGNDSGVWGWVITYPMIGKFEEE